MWEHVHSHFCGGVKTTPFHISAVDEMLNIIKNSNFYHMIHVSCESLFFPDNTRCHNIGSFYSSHKVRDIKNCLL